MTVLYFLATSLSSSVPQAYFIAYACPLFSDSFSTSDKPPSLSCNLYFSIYHAKCLHGYNYFSSRSNYDWALTLWNRSFLTPLFFSLVSKVGGPTQYFEFFLHARKINFSVYNASMECKLLVKNYLKNKT